MMSRRARNRSWMPALTLALTGLTLSAGCDDGGAVEGVPPPSASAPSAPAAEAEKPAAASAQADKELTVPPIGEMDFIAGARSRDPFSPFSEIFVHQQEAERTVQRDVKLKEYDIADLKLIGIITNIGDPRAMVVTPDGTGYVVRRGDYVGRADFVKQGAHGETIQVNWRVARIHGSGKEEERGVYFVRDDPTTTKGVDVTRFLPLYATR